MYLFATNLNLPVVIIVGIAALALVVFLVRRNVKDEKEFEDTIKHVDEKPPGHDEEN